MTAFPKRASGPCTYYRLQRKLKCGQTHIWLMKWTDVDLAGCRPAVPVFLEETWWSEDFRWQYTTYITCKKTNCVFYILFTDFCMNITDICSLKIFLIVATEITVIIMLIIKLWLLMIASVNIAVKSVWTSINCI
jgi:hypothetical protein